MPSSVGYLVAAFAAAVALFFGLWWTLVSGGDEAPWIPAGLAACVVLLVALSAREVVMRRAWTRYLLEQGTEPASRSGESKRSTSKTYSSSLLAAALRNIQKQSAAADVANNPEAHLEVFQLARDYLTTTDQALRSNSLSSEKRNSIRSSQERVRPLQKHHLLTWARDTSRALTYEAQQRARMTERVETANRALHCLQTALQYYPNETELQESSVAIEEFISSVKVAHWVELAERSAFKGQYRRAIDRYRDALFYLEKGTMKDDLKASSAQRIESEIQSLQARIRARKNTRAETAGNHNDEEPGRGVR
jgi:hypothetical protein